MLLSDITTINPSFPLRKLFIKLHTARFNSSSEIITVTRTSLYNSNSSLPIRQTRYRKVKHDEWLHVSVHVTHSTIRQQHTEEQTQVNFHYLPLRNTSHKKPVWLFTWPHSNPKQCKKTCHGISAVCSTSNTHNSDPFWDHTVCIELLLTVMWWKFSTYDVQRQQNIIKCIVMAGGKTHSHQ